MPNLINIGEDSFDRDNINQPQRPIGEQPGYRLVKGVVKRTLAEMGETGMHKYALFKGYAIDFLRDFYTTIGGGQNVTVRELEVDSLNRVALPDDYIDFIKIGARVGDRVQVFIRDEDLALYTDTTKCHVNQPNPTAYPEDETYPYNLQFWFNNPLNAYGEHTGGFYGFGAGRVFDAFTIDNGSIQLSSNISSEVIYLEYISSNLIYGEETYVPIVAEEAMKSYIKYKFESDRREPKEYIVNRRQREYSNNFKIARRKIKPLTVEDILFASRRGVGSNF